MIELVLLSLLSAVVTDAVQRARPRIRVYHGSREPDIEELEPRNPGYEGSLGWGIYVSEDLDVCRTYGPYTYVLDLELDESEILTIDGYSVEHHEELEGQSILVGEHVEPFTFVAGDERYFVGDEDMKRQIAMIRFKRILARRTDLARAVTPHLIEGWGDPLPSFEDRYDLEEVKDRIWPPDHDPDEAETIRLEAEAKALMDELRATVLRLEAETERMGEATDLEEIGRVARRHGYKAVRFDGMRGGHSSLETEILVLDPARLRMLGKLRPHGDLEEP
jgi:hypothetical protein